MLPRLVVQVLPSLFQLGTAFVMQKGSQHSPGIYALAESLTLGKGVHDLDHHDQHILALAEV